MRQDDHEKKCYFRSSDRVFRMNGHWYFATREGDKGPFQSELNAHAEIKRFITEKTELAHFQQTREDESENGVPVAAEKLELVALDEPPTLQLQSHSALQQKVYS